MRSSLYPPYVKPRSNVKEERRYTITFTVGETTRTWVDQNLDTLQEIRRLASNGDLKLNLAERTDRV